MTLRELEYLVALARFRHFGRAAEACCVSQPTLSTQLKKLEGELGMQLVERGTGGVLLTPFGKATAERARKILAEVQHIKDAAQEARDPESGAALRAGFTTKDIGRGTGLGLSIAHELATSHGGRLTANNDADGVSFHLRLPCQQG